MWNMLNDTMNLSNLILVKSSTYLGFSCRIWAAKIETAGQYCFQLISPKLRGPFIEFQFLFGMMSFQCQESTCRMHVSWLTVHADVRIWDQSRNPTPELTIPQTTHNTIIHEECFLLTLF